MLLMVVLTSSRPECVVSVSTQTSDKKIVAVRCATSEQEV